MDQWRYRRQVCWCRRAKMYFGIIRDVQEARDILRTGLYRTRAAVNLALDVEVMALNVNGVV